MRPVIIVMALAMAVAPAQGGEMTAHGMVSRLDLSEWVGGFFADEERSITIFLWDKSTLQIDGLLTLGLFDADRVAAGKVDISEFSVRIPESWIYANNQIEFMPGPDGAVPPDQAGADDCVIVLRLDWNVNWIDVTDNGRCSETASFTGRYEYRPLDWND